MAGPEHVVGRERELAAIDELLASDEPGLRALAIEGEPGIGKTTLWTEATAAAALPVISCRAVEAEAKLPYASLADLVAPLFDAGLASLPEPQSRALEVALLRVSSTGRAPELRAVATGVHSLLRDAAPLLVAIDDVQWLDPPSAAALAFALRRLATAPVRVLLAVRVERGRDVDVLGLDCPRVRVGPLSLSGIHHVIRSQLGQVLPRPTLRRIVDASGGNPLFALELARALVEVGARPVPGEPLPVPDTLADLMHDRIAKLPAAARDALLAAASLADPTVEAVSAANGDRNGAGLAAAERAGVVTLRGGSVRFAHPLLASTVYASAAPERRRELHRLLAGQAASPEERARHLALAVEGADEEVAAQLEDAAHEANRRGAPQAAVELSELAYRVTPADRPAERAGRLFTLAECAFRAGDAAEAKRHVDKLIDEQPVGPVRARALELCARILFVSGTSLEAAAVCEQALVEAGDDVELQARIHTTYARVMWDDFEIARRHCRLALELMEQIDEPDPVLLSSALCAEAGFAVYAGEPWPAELIERALELERIAPNPDVADRMSAALGAWLKLAGDFDGARHWLELTHRAAIEEGDEASLPYALSHLPQLDLWTGRWDDAERRALEHLELAEATAQPRQRLQALYNLAVVHAHMGRVDDARDEAETLLRESDDNWDVSNALAVLGFLDLSLGDAAAAASSLARNLELRDAIGNDEPLRAQADLADALIDLGELDRAEETIASLDERAHRTDRAPLRALAAAATARLAAARQELDEAIAAIDEAHAQHARVTVPFDLARTLLVEGQIRRRRAERKAARDALERGHAIFTELGARLWADRAAAEARRIPIRRGAGDELTETEQQVAELVAAGHTNKEAAQALFMSPKTVEAHLSRIYRKLDVSTRAQLGVVMANRAGQTMGNRPM